MVDAILMIAGYGNWISNYQIFIGMYPDYTKNTECALPVGLDVVKPWNPPSAQSAW